MTEQDKVQALGKRLVTQRAALGRLVKAIDKAVLYDGRHEEDLDHWEAVQEANATLREAVQHAKEVLSLREGFASGFNPAATAPEAAVVTPLRVLIAGLTVSDLQSPALLEAYDMLAGWLLAQEGATNGN